MTRPVWPRNPQVILRTIRWLVARLANLGRQQNGRAAHHDQGERS